MLAPMSLNDLFAVGLLYVLHFIYVAILAQCEETLIVLVDIDP